MSDLLVGIDLGTSNCAVAYADPNRGTGAPILDYQVRQLRRLGDVAPQPLLPSCLYIPGEHELPAEAIALPWDPTPQHVIGEFARWQGARVPGRLVVSAKSWLSHPGVDRSAPILPWGGSPGVARVSPVEASARLLEHIAKSWNLDHPDAPLTHQEVVITVPASFDEVARALTVSAARRAGFEKFTLLEEPQAAFYDFTARHREELARVLENVRLVLVIDVGGGTSDFTLVQVGMSSEGLSLRRIAVGDHLMLGGDNMDAAVARKAEERMVAGGRKLSPTQWTQLVQAARLAKQELLSDTPAASFHLSVAGEGSRLIGSSLSAELSRREVEDIVLEGFFPHCPSGELPRRSARVALQELGLPYAQDPAITRQLAGFVHAHAHAGNPDTILLNGGVFNSSRIAARLVEVISSWWSDSRLRVLQHVSLDLAVARGAGYYGLVRRGMGRRIGGGTAHAFYIGLESRRAEAPLALCVIPRGHEEGETVELGGRTFNLTLGRPVQFPLYSATSERVESSGDIVPVSEDMHPLPPIHTLLKSAEDKSGQAPVHLRATLTEIGTLELWCVSGLTGERWRLEFELRGVATAASPTVVESMPPRFAEARKAMEQVYGRAAPVGSVPTPAKQLWRALEQMLGPREQWRVPVLRELWGSLFAGVGRRRRSADHERIFFQLAGYALRPGFGYPLDEWRAEQMAGLFGQPLQFHQEKPVWIEYWVMWRRIAGGLTEGRQQEIWSYLKPHLSRRLSPHLPKQPAKLKGVQPEGLDEMVRLASSLEHLSPEEKIQLGEWITERLRAAATPGGPWAWALGRVGARVPLYGSGHKVVDAEVASAWLRLLLDEYSRNVEGVLFAIVQLARLSGDRSRDIPGELRTEALNALQASQAPDSWQRLLIEVVAMETADKARAFGDTLPVGLAASPL